MLMSIITVLLCHLLSISAAGTVTTPIYQLDYYEINIPKCLSVTWNDKVVDVPYGAVVYGYLIDSPVTNGPVKYSSAGIYEKGYVDALKNPTIMQGTTWSVQTSARAGSAKTTGQFMFCATVSELPATGVYYLQVQAQWQT